MRVSTRLLLGMALLPPETLALHEGHPMHPNLDQRLLYFIQLEGPYNRFNFL